MTICILIPTFLPLVGGAEIGVCELAKALLRKGHSVTIVTPHKYPEAPRHEYLDGVEIYRYWYAWPVNPLRGVADLVYPFIFLGSILKKVQPDVLNLHFLQYTGYGGYWWARRLGIAAVLSFTGWDAYDPFKKLPGYRRKTMKWVMNQDIVIATPTNAVKQILERDFGIAGERILVTHWGVDINRFNCNNDGTPIRKRHGISPEKKVVLAVQRLDRRKGVQYFLDAAHEILRQRKDVSFLIVGKGPEYEQLIQRNRELGLEKEVIFAGFVEDDDLPLYYAAADIFALHSFFEVMGIVLLEAMATGKPVVTTDAGGTVEGVRDGVNGYVVPPGDSKRFSEAILRVLDDPDTAARFGANGRRIVEQEFSHDVMADHYLAAYQRAVGRGRRGP